MEVCVPPAPLHLRVCSPQCQRLQNTLFTKYAGSQTSGGWSAAEQKRVSRTTIRILSPLPRQTPSHYARRSPWEAAEQESVSLGLQKPFHLFDLQFCHLHEGDTDLSPSTAGAEACTFTWHAQGATKPLNIAARQRHSPPSGGSTRQFWFGIYCSQHTNSPSL